MVKPSMTRRKGYAAAEKFRSKFEKTISAALKKACITYTYEQDVLAYTVPMKTCKYTPDFKGAKSGIFLEVKGIFDLADRQKHLLIREQYPHLDIRLVFQNANAKIYKRSKTTYAMWCDKHNIKWCHKVLPASWIKELKHAH